MDAKTILDELAQQQAQWRANAECAKSNYNKLRVTPVDKLEDYYLSICYSGEVYDPDLKIRRRIIRLLPDLKLINLLGVRMPTRLVYQIEMRLRPKENKGTRRSQRENEDR